MAFIPTSGVVCTYFRFTKENQQIEFGICWQHDGGETPPRDDAALVEDLASDAEVNIVSVMTNDAVFREIYAVPQDNEVIGTITRAITPPVTGTIGSPMPNNVALAIKFATANRGRAGRGRIYWPFWGEDQVNGSTIAQSAVNDVLSFIAGLDTVAAAGGYTRVVVSRQLNGVPRTEGLAQAVTATLATDLTVDSQRRRLPGRGR